MHDEPNEPKDRPARVRFDIPLIVVAAAVVAILLLVGAIVATLAWSSDDADDDKESTRADAATMEGEYYCSHIVRGGISDPCDNTANALTLTKRGTWSWYVYAGQYRVEGKEIVFDARDYYQGPPSWGDGMLIDGGITFTTASKVSYWLLGQVPGQDLGKVAGSYVCETTTGSDGRPTSCTSGARLVLAQDGTWRYGAGYSGEFTLRDGEVVFRACCSYDGPSTWGPARVGDGTLTFRASTQPTVYRLVEG